MNRSLVSRIQLYNCTFANFLSLVVWWTGGNFESNFRFGFGQFLERWRRLTELDGRQAEVDGGSFFFFPKEVHLGARPERRVYTVAARALPQTGAGPIACNRKIFATDVSDVRDTGARRKLEVDACN